MSSISNQWRWFLITGLSLYLSEIKMSVTVLLQPCHSNRDIVPMLELLSVPHSHYLLYRINVSESILGKRIELNHNKREPTLQANSKFGLCYTPYILTLRTERNEYFLPCFLRVGDTHNSLTQFSQYKIWKCHRL